MLPLAKSWRDIVNSSTAVAYRVGKAEDFDVLFQIREPAIINELFATQVIGH